MRLSRGAVVTASVGDPAGKPRPFVVLRSDHFAEHALVTLVAFSTTPNETPTLRVPVEPSAGNGLREASLAMIDRIVSVHGSGLARSSGSLPTRTSRRSPTPSRFISASPIQCTGHDGGSAPDGP